MIKERLKFIDILDPEKDAKEIKRLEDEIESIKMRMVGAVVSHENK